METTGTGQNPSGKKTILIVDDEIGPRESLRMILKPFYEVYAASDGKQAIRVVSEKDIDVVTLDLNMPGLSGIEVLREIRKLRPEMEVIVVTGYGSLENASEAIRLGAGNLISKPFNVSEIISVLAKAIERRSDNLKIKRLAEIIPTLSSADKDVPETDKKKSE
jgi:putative two-component system response regulator